MKAFPGAPKLPPLPMYSGHGPYPWPAGRPAVGERVMDRVLKSWGVGYVSEFGNQVCGVAFPDMAGTGHAFSYLSKIYLVPVLESPGKG